jgi:glycosyltransferase involved in cell wall biosynthesis
MYATFGGVERVLLNRFDALYDHYNGELKTDLLFLWDSGALNSFKESLRSSSKAFLWDVDFKKKDIYAYDMVSIVDSPCFYENVKKYQGVLCLECHTLYKKNRIETFSDVPENISFIIVPSQYQKQLVIKENPNLAKNDNVFILPNFVPDDFYDINEPARLPDWNCRPIAFFHRLDALKNYIEAIDIFCGQEKLGEQEIILCLSGKIDNDIKTTLKYLYEFAGEQFYYLPRIHFSQMPKCLYYIRKKAGIFLSTSTAESFGMSVAEAMSVGLPVLLSNIEPHRELVEDNDKYLYRLGDVADGVAKLHNLLADEYERLSNEVKALSVKFQKRAFLNAWDNLVANIHRYGGVAL